MGCVGSTTSTSIQKYHVHSDHLQSTSAKARQRLNEAQKETDLRRQKWLEDRQLQRQQSTADRRTAHRRRSQGGKAAEDTSYRPAQVTLMGAEFSSASDLNGHGCSPGDVLASLESPKGRNDNAVTSFGRHPQLQSGSCITCISSGDMNDTRNVGGALSRSQSSLGLMGFQPVANLNMPTSALLPQNTTAKPNQLPRWAEREGECSNNSIGLTTTAVPTALNLPLLTVTAISNDEYPAQLLQSLRTPNSHRSIASALKDDADPTSVLDAHTNMAITTSGSPEGFSSKSKSTSHSDDRIKGIPAEVADIVQQLLNEEVAYRTTVKARDELIVADATSSSGLTGSYNGQRAINADLSSLLLFTAQTNIDVRCNVSPVSNTAHLDQYNFIINPAIDGPYPSKGLSSARLPSPVVLRIKRQTDNPDLGHNGQLLSSFVDSDISLHTLNPDDFPHQKQWRKETDREWHSSDVNGGNARSSYAKQLVSTNTTSESIWQVGHGSASTVAGVGTNGNRALWAAMQNSGSSNASSTLAKGPISFSEKDADLRKSDNSQDPPPTLPF